MSANLKINCLRIEQFFSSGIWYLTSLFSSFPHDLKQMHYEYCKKKDSILIFGVFWDFDLHRLLYYCLPMGVPFFTLPFKIRVKIVIKKIMKILVLLLSCLKYHRTSCTENHIKTLKIFDYFLIISLFKEVLGSNLG